MSISSVLIMNSLLIPNLLDYSKFMLTLNLSLRLCLFRFRAYAKFRAYYESVLSLLIAVSI